LLSTLGLGEGGGGEGGEGDMHGILETLMSQLMSKDILYEPLNELKQKVRNNPESRESYLTSLAVPRVSGRKRNQIIVRGFGTIQEAACDRH
jgi:hypothetical protein